MATILELKILDRSDSVSIPIQIIVRWLKLSEEDEEAVNDVRVEDK